MQQGQGIGNRLRVMDVTNGIEQIVSNGVQRERWTQQCTVTPAAGATYLTPISVPATHNITEFSVSVVTTLGTITSFGVGWAGSATALYAAVAVAGGVPGVSALNNAAVPPASSIAIARIVGKTFSGAAFCGTRWHRSFRIYRPRTFLIGCIA